MKKASSFLSALLPLLALSAPVEARPVAATLYPAGAVVTEEAEATPVDGRIVLQLPAGADAGSLSVLLSRGEVLGRTLTLLPGQPAPAVKALQKEADALRGSIDRKYSELASVAAMRSFWSQPPYSLSAPSLEMLNEFMEQLSRDSARQMEDIAAKEAALRAEIRDMERLISTLDARIRALGTQNADVDQCVLSVDGTGPGPVNVRWSYWFESANWKPQYRVAACSATGQVQIRMEAELLQNSGTDWSGVELTLASSNRLYSVQPPALRPWVIGQASYDAAPRVMMGSRNAVMKAEAAAPVSADEAGLTWSLGRMDVPASSAVTRLVGQHELGATFSRLLRPRQSEDVWLYAALDGKALAASPALLLPTGQASFLVDGRETARGPFSFGPASRDIFFGIDQLMKAEVVQTAAQDDIAPAPASGEDEPGKPRVEQWSWISTVHSGHDKAVALRVEEAAPIARQAGVKISVSTSPKAELEAEKSRYIWSLPVPARGRAELRYEVKAVIPEVRQP